MVTIVEMYLNRPHPALRTGETLRNHVVELFRPPTVVAVYVGQTCVLCISTMKLVEQRHSFDAKLPALLLLSSRYVRLESEQLAETPLSTATVSNSRPPFLGEENKTSFSVLYRWCNA